MNACQWTISKLLDGMPKVQKIVQDQSRTIWDASRKNNYEFIYDKPGTNLEPIRDQSQTSAT